MISPDPVPAPLEPFALIVTTDGRTFCATCVTWQDEADDWLPADVETPVVLPEEELEDDEGELIAFAITPPTTPPTTAHPAQAISSQDPAPRPFLRACVDVIGIPPVSQCC